MENNMWLINAYELCNEFQKRYRDIDKGRSFTNEYMPIYDGIRLDEIENGIALVNNAPAIDAVPVVHAHWAWAENRPIADDDDPECIGRTGYECSACGNNERTSVRFYEELSSMMVLELKEGLKESLTNYCHNCGAKMDMEVDYGSD